MPEIYDYAFKYHKRGGHVISYAINKQAAGATSYYQYVSTDGYWYIMKSVIDTGVTTYTYTVPVSVDTTSLADGWTGRAALDYTTFDKAFV